MNIRGYELVDKWKISNRGSTAIAIRDGKRYFLKQYSMYKMPKHDSAIAEATYNRMKNEFESFKNNRESINRALSELAGPNGNIILPTDWFVEDSCYIEASAFVSDLIEDEDILTLSIEEKVFIMLTASAALHNIHRKKIVHSDLKRTNILAARQTGSGKIVAKIIDFDASYFQDDIHIEELGGDQNFMSPELLYCIMTDYSDEAVADLSVKSDIFSLGLVFHDYLVTETYVDEEGNSRTRGCHPQIVGLTGKMKERFESGKTVYCCEALLNGGQLVVSKKIKEKYLRHLIAAMIQPDPADRPTALEVREAIKNKTILDVKSDMIKVEGEEAAPLPSREEKEPTEIPVGFCEPWVEHAIVFDEGRLRDKGFVASKQYEHAGSKRYYFYTSDGKPKSFTVDSLLLLGYANRAGVDKKEVTTRGTRSTTSMPSVAITVYDDRELWDSDSSYRYDTDAIKKIGYKGIARAEKNGMKGYVLIKITGEQRFITFANLKQLRCVVKK